MGLEIHMIGKPQGKAVKVDRRLYLDRTGTRVLEEGDPDVAALLAPAGGLVPFEQAKALGLVEEPAEKKQDKPADKRRRPAPANKSRGRRG